MPKKPLTPEMAAVMARLRAEIESRGFTVHQVAIEMNIRPASFTDGSMSQHWIKLALRFGFSLDWVLLGNRNFQRENQRLTEVVADLSARLGVAIPVDQASLVPQPKPTLDQVVDRLNEPGLTESRRSRKKKHGARETV